jgi:hypothetical protein
LCHPLLQRSYALLRSRLCRLQLLRETLLLLVELLFIEPHTAQHDVLELDGN